MMKTILQLTAAVALVATLPSCATGPNARTGTVLGALGGAAAGGIIGHQSGRGLEGAAIGAGLGALGGNIVGGASDQRNAYYGPRSYHGHPGYYQRAPHYYRRSPRYYGY